MTAPRFYSWDDDGSPGRALTGNLQNRLKQILVACLVNGYGSKPGAGWTLEHEHANGFTLSNGDAYVNFVSNLPASAPYPAMNANAIHIYASESLTDTSKAIIDGANLCSGGFRKGLAESAGYPRHMLGVASNTLSSGLASLQWTLVADDKTFTLNCSTGSSSSNSAFNSLNYSFTLYCGKSTLDADVSGNFVVLGGDIANYNSPATSYALCRGYSAPVNPATGLSEIVTVGAEPYLSGFALSPSGESAQCLSRLNLQQPRLSCDAKFVGRLRGVVYDDVLRSLYGWEEHLKVMGFSGAEFNDRGKLVLIDGYNYAFARSASGNSIITDNPAFW